MTEECKYIVFDDSCSISLGASNKKRGQEMSRRYDKLASAFTNLYNTSCVAKYCCQDLLADEDITPEQYAKFMEAITVIHTDLTNVVRKKLNKLFTEE
jgi:hypothetical protein